MLHDPRSSVGISRSSQAKLPHSIASTSFAELEGAELRLEEFSRFAKIIKNCFPLEHPANFLLNSIPQSSLTTAEQVSLCLSAMRVAAYEVTADKGVFRADPATLIDSLSCISDSYDGTRCKLSAWRKGTEIQAFRSREYDVEHGRDAPPAHNIVIKIPHPNVAPVAIARAMKKQVFAQIMNEEVTSSAILMVEPLTVHHHFWIQRHIPGLTMEEACCSPNAEVAAAALKVWDNVHTVLNGTIWSSCWDSVAELLTTLNLTHMERNDLGKGYPDADPRNFILKGLTPHCSVESVITASRVMIDW